MAVGARTPAGDSPRGGDGGRRHGARTLHRPWRHAGRPAAEGPLHDFAVEFVDDRVYPNDENLDVGFNGFARMALRDDKLTLDYLDVRGTRVFTETWTVERGQLIRLKARRGQDNEPCSPPVARLQAPIKRQRSSIGRCRIWSPLLNVPGTRKRPRRRLSGANSRPRADLGRGREAA